MPSSRDNWVGKTILVTGGAGYLASNLVRLLADTPCRIVRLDKPETAFTPVAGAADVCDLTGDVRDRAVWERALDGVDAVFHFAAQTSVYVAAQHPCSDLEINVRPALHLLETCMERSWRPVILFSGTVTECGVPDRVPVDETHPDRPITIYDVHKLTTEGYLKHYAAEGRVRSAVLRLANVYGPGPKSSSADRGVLNLMIRKALAGETLTVYGTGEHLRDYVFVEDVAEAFLAAGANIEATNGRHFVIGSGKGHTIAQAIRMAADRVALKTGRRAPVTHIEPPGPQSPIEARNFVADSTRFKQATGWRPRVSLAEGMDRTIACFLENEGADS